MWRCRADPAGAISGPNPRSLQDQTLRHQAKGPKQTKSRVVIVAAPAPVWLRRARGPDGFVAGRVGSPPPIATAWANRPRAAADAPSCGPRPPPCRVPLVVFHPNGRPGHGLPVSPSVLRTDRIAPGSWDQSPSTCALWAANSSSLRMPWSLSVASCLSSSIRASLGSFGCGRCRGWSLAGGAAGAWAAAALFCADFAPMWAAVPATTAVVAIRATGLRRRSRI